MSMLRRVWTVATIVSALSFLSISELRAESAHDRLIAAAVGGDLDAVNELRVAGQAAVDSLRARRASIAQQLSTAETAAEGKELMARYSRINELIDRVGGARYCSESGLYWHTDLATALERARSEGKPILSLALLGKLTEEYSCANSRFFRTTLYVHPTISDELRRRFVLHWRSVRPVPTVTIDFGDGRVVRQTITGNSAHYVLGHDGRPLDVLPGLHAPSAFRQWLTNSASLAAVYNKAPADRRSQVLRDHHTAALAAINEKRDRELREIGMGFLVETPEQLSTAELKRVPTAAEASLRAKPKSAGELRLVRELGRPSPWTDPEFRQRWLEAASSLIAKRHPEWRDISTSAASLMRRETPPAAVATALAVTKRRAEVRTLAFVNNFRDSLAVDTVFNEYELHRQAHAWFLNADKPLELIGLNDRVYAELFLTPKDDPWLGLAGEDVYTGLRDGGRVTKPESQADAGSP